MRGRAANLEQVLDTFPRLRERLGQLAGSMSGGEQQMLAIGRADGRASAADPGRASLGCRR